ncbi:MAG: hypothetical protein P4L41_12880 [Flavipsychrobacter sp.]|nr:hypothetical protein [Flavipsychrobacter sp.]
MSLKYKLNGERASREDLTYTVGIADLITRWENAVRKFAADIDREKVSIILHLVNGELKIITDTRMLMKLYCEVYKNMFQSSTLKQAVRT